MGGIFDIILVGGIFNDAPSVVHAQILRASTNIGRGPVVQFTSSNDTHCFCSEVDRHNARPSKVLTTERGVFFSDDYEIESGQGNDKVRAGNSE